MEKCSYLHAALYAKSVNSDQRPGKAIKEPQALGTNMGIVSSPGRGWHLSLATAPCCPAIQDPAVTPLGQGPPTRHPRHLLSSPLTEGSHSKKISPISHTLCDETHTIHFPFIKTEMRKTHPTSLVVQWLSFCTPNAGDPDLIPGQRTRSQVLQLKNPHATAGLGTAK